MKKIIMALCLSMFFSFPIHAEENMEFTLPVEGASCYIAAAYGDLKAGDVYRIKEEKEGSFIIEDEQRNTKEVPENYLLINLPDVLPNIVYNNTNAYSALYKSSGKELIGITGNQLYETMYDNERLGFKQYVMPVMYGMAKKIAKAQNIAEKQGDTLVIYETYRPYDTQMRVKDALTDAMNADPYINQGVTVYPWDKSWFIAQSLSNHQRGCAMDVSLAKTKKRQTMKAGKNRYWKVTDWEEYDMPTPMHELSAAAVTFAWPVDSKSDSAWRNAEPASTMTAAALRLQKICTDADMSPLASEWWHFNDLKARKNAVANGSFHLCPPISKKH